MNPSRKARALSLALLALASFDDACAAIFYVGAGCEYEDLQAAIDHAASTGDSDEIRIVDNREYSNLALSINDGGALDVAGGFKSCGGDAREGEITLDGAGGPLAPVLVVNAEGTIRLRFLRIVNGDSVGNGGGIRYTTATGTLELDSVIVSGNTAAFSGGGLSASGPSTFDARAENRGDGPRVRIGDFVFFTDNAAADGAGAALANLRLDMSDASLSGFFGNHATHDGGGVHLVSVAADIGSGRIGGLLFQNVADGAGGGLYVGPGSEVRLFTTHADRAVAITDNRAESGGGLAIHGGEIGPARVSVFDGVIDGNVAIVGSAVYMDTGGGANVAAFCLRDRLHAPEEGECADVVAPESAVDCAPSLRCNRLSQNSTPPPELRGGDPGAVLQVQGACARLDLRGTFLEDNTGTSLIARSSPVDVAGWGVAVADSLAIANEAFGGALIESAGFVELAIAGSTIADNRFLADHVLDTDGDTTLTESIVWQPDTFVHANPFDPSLHASASMVLANDASTLAFEPGTVIIDDPLFVDPPIADYRLSAASPAIDFSGKSGASAFDIDGHARGVDDVDATDRFGPRDLGAYEAEPPDRIFADGFERAD